MKSIELAGGAGAGIVAGSLFGFWGGVITLGVVVFVVSVYRKFT